MSTWQPIDTAPKTSDEDWVGKCILVWVPAPDAPHGGDCYVAWWEPGPAYRCWHWADGDGQPFPIQPTHWMPLPPPPGAAPLAGPPPRAEQWEDRQRLPTTHHDMPADRDPETPIMETMIPRPSGDGGAP